VAGFFNVRFLLFFVPRLDDFFVTFLVGGGALSAAGTALACACSITTTSSSLVRRRYSTTMTTMTRHQIIQHTALAKIMSHSIGKGSADSAGLRIFSFVSLAVSLSGALFVGSVSGGGCARESMFDNNVVVGV